MPFFPTVSRRLCCPKCQTWTPWMLTVFGEARCVDPGRPLNGFWTCADCGAVLRPNDVEVPGILALGEEDREVLLAPAQTREGPSRYFYEICPPTDLVMSAIEQHGQHGLRFVGSSGMVIGQQGSNLVGPGGQPIRQQQMQPAVLLVFEPEPSPKDECCPVTLR